MSARHYHLGLADTPWVTLSPGDIRQPRAGHLHLWRTPLLGREKDVATAKTFLSTAELARAARFHYARDHVAYVITRSTLRRILGRCLRRNPRTLEFVYGSFGKPALVTDDPSTTLQFNVAHAGGYALLGFTTGADLGVDLEPENDDLEIFRLIDRYFSPEETKQVMALPVADRVPAFFRTWTRKEAFIKANGAGLSLPLEQFGVSVGINEPTRLRRIDWAPDEVDQWALGSFMVAERLPGAAVTGGKLEQVCYYDVPATWF